MLQPNEFAYFAYGSNMSEPRLAQRVNPFRRIAIGYLDGYRLTFDKVSVDGSGKCDCEHTGAAGHRVWGVVFAMDVGKQAALDKAEGVGSGYDRHKIELPADIGVITAVTYFATRKKPGLSPYRWYKDHVLFGARAAQLPPEYIAAIEAIASMEDQKPGRADEQLAVYKNVLL
ncbi:gamma-glutamylcyclotransferase [bacterium M00.F.Ca.ET.228.01.1.1]|nr:gamma-glutamylcyclotransferase [Paraburkholderia phenoliruptrix]MBW9097765.1 gamma-glutamylcyclotransferase [Paraburkholderia phenoliruptrix]TGP45212.1 gamma-glutamylcyclotransferase [bacterium M00.F.Ca.ET.228.01.1.1]TGS03095.1 gamma-glutamylcyclotransferase [bacterium M00.F.Ca.ET.191.01.1.1]TGU06477.1 gamma-glutamylcyclotransferase [bacterium M00.F.Ca.ET.155.01.1.1]